MPKVTQANKYQYFDTLTQLQMGADEAKIYEYLLQNGPHKASAIGAAIKLSRVLTYRGLGKLVNKDIVIKHDDPGSVTTFEAAHPSSLVSLLDKQKQRLNRAELELESIVGKMASDYNLTAGKPNIQFFEGIDGIRQVAHACLNSSNEIKLLTDASKIRSDYAQLNLEFMRQARSKRAKLRILLEPNVKPLAANAATETFQHRNLIHEVNFATTVFVYDNIVSFITLENDRNIGATIEDPSISMTMHALFDTLWNHMSTEPESLI